MTSRVFRPSISAANGKATFLAIATPAQESGRNYLDVANIGGTYVIRALDSGLLGESFSFGATKSVKSKALRASTEPAMAVPVSMATLVLTCAVGRAVIARLRFVRLVVPDRSWLTDGVPACCAAEGARSASSGCPFKPSADNCARQLAAFGRKVRTTAFHDHCATSLH
jgi:hypothetical protein